MTIDAATVSRDLQRNLAKAIKSAQRKSDLPPFDLPEEIVVERPKQESMGDFASPVCMQLARLARMAPIKIAEQVVRRHLLAERLLTDILGLSWAEAHQEAGKWEHVISDNVETAIIKLLEDPTTCPHGNPIPGSAYQAPDTVALSDLGVGAGFTIKRIPEELEFTPGLLEFLEDAAILPGHHGTVTASSPDGTTTVEIDGRHIGVGSFASARILVTAG